MTAPGNQYPSQYPENPQNPQYPPQYPPPQYPRSDPYAPPPPPPPGYGQPYPQSTPQYPPPVARSSRRTEGVKQIAGGLTALVVGLAITIGTYQLASGGGMYFVAYGPMIFGVLYVCKGLVNVMRG